LYVRNLPYICKEEDIEALFSPFGKYNTILPEPEVREISVSWSVPSQGQSVFPDIALHIGNYCVYYIED
jgi:RNA recognition motif-containing protein